MQMAQGSDGRWYYTNATNSTAASCRITFDSYAPPTSPLRSLQTRLQASNRPRIYKMGNLVSALRFYLWKLGA